MVTIDSAQSGARLDTLTVTLRAGRWPGPAGIVGQLDLQTGTVAVSLADGDIQISVDPLFGDAADAALCTPANLAAIRDALVPELTARLGGFVDDAIAGIIGAPCPCPSGTACVANRCETAGGDVLPRPLGIEGRIALDALLTGFAQSPIGDLDMSVLAGGSAGADGAGFVVGAVGGAVAQAPTPGCAPPGPDPRTLPGYQPPVALSLDETIDLDFDGTAESSPMVAVALSQPLLDQLAWAAHGTSVGCLDIAGDTIELLNTGALGITLPSLRRLTGADLDPRANYPVRVTLFAPTPPSVRVGTARSTEAQARPRWSTR